MRRIKLDTAAGYARHSALSSSPLPWPSSNRRPCLEARRRRVEAYRRSEDQLCVPRVVIDGPSYRAKLAPRPSSTEAAMP